MTNDSNNPAGDSHPRPMTGRPLPPPGALPPPVPDTTQPGESGVAGARTPGMYSRMRSEMVAGGATTSTPPADRTSGVVAGIVMVGLLAWLGVTNPWMLLFVVGIIVSIFLHEVGHYSTAKWAGMKVTQFFMGFGPKVWSTQRGEVEWGVRAIPAGAFVRIIGMSSADEVESGDETRTYRQQPYRWRLLVITAGSLMHIIIAFVLLLIVFSGWGYQEEVGQVTVAAAPSADSPAAAAGIQEGDIIVAVGGETIETRDELITEIQSYAPGDTTLVTVDRGGEVSDVPVTLAQNPSFTEPVAFLGVASSSVDWVDQSLPSAAGLAVTEMGRGIASSVTGVVTVLNPVNIWNHLTGETEDITTRPTTLVGATQVSGTLGEEDGLRSVLMLLAGVNVFVGIFNLFPLLPFDGGHAAIATYERIRSRRGQRYYADVNKMMPAVVVVLTLIGFLFATGLYLDITKPL
jgi:membrane-associated protease RseP (regulator of RpoE activity)